MAPKVNHKRKNRAPTENRMVVRKVPTENRMVVRKQKKKSDIPKDQQMVVRKSDTLALTNNEANWSNNKVISFLTNTFNNKGEMIFKDLFWNVKDSKFARAIRNQKNQEYAKMFVDGIKAVNLPAMVGMPQYSQQMEQILTIAEKVGVEVTESVKLTAEETKEEAERMKNEEEDRQLAIENEERLAITANGEPDDDDESDTGTMVDPTSDDEQNGNLEADGSFKRQLPQRKQKAESALELFEESKIVDANQESAVVHRVFPKESSGQNLITGNEDDVDNDEGYFANWFKSGGGDVQPPTLSEPDDETQPVDPQPQPQPQTVVSGNAGVVNVVDGVATTTPAAPVSAGGESYGHDRKNLSVESMRERIKCFRVSFEGDITTKEWQDLEKKSVDSMSASELRDTLVQMDYIIREHFNATNAGTLRVGLIMPLAGWGTANQFAQVNTQTQDAQQPEEDVSRRLADTTTVVVDKKDVASGFRRGANKGLLNRLNLESKGDDEANVRGRIRLYEKRRDGVAGLKYRDNHHGIYEPISERLRKLNIHT